VTMQAKRRLVLHVALAAITSTTIPIGCATRRDAISQAERTEKSRPGIAETRAIAEEGFIYGLPIVMNYAVMYEYAVDRASDQFKAPFNQIRNEPRVFTYKDTAVVTPNSDTPYSFAWMDLRAEPIVLSVPAVEKGRYYSVMLCDGNTFNYGYIGSRATGSGAGDYMVVGPDWKGETPPHIKKVFRSSTQFSLAGYRTQLFNPADMKNVEKIQAGYRVQTVSAYLKQPADTIGPTTQDGIADVVQSLFLSPKAPGPGGDHLGWRPRLPVSCERRADRTGEVRSRSDGGRPPPGERWTYGRAGEPRLVRRR
jgi:hypothetical protein